MKTPVEIAFRHFEPSDAVRTEIAAEARRLDRFSPRITSCRVTVAGPHGRRRNGDPFEVALSVALPGGRDIFVDRRRGDAPEPEHVLVAIRQAFDAARRQVEEAEREIRGEIKARAQKREGRIAKRAAIPT